ncbi:tetratricopeptide repeat protein [Planctomycetaceae bacterium SH139]
MSSQDHTRPDITDSLGSQHAAEIDELVVGLRERQLAGEPIDIEAVVSQHPAEWADPIREVWSAYQLLEQFNKPEIALQITDYDIVRELGRGGMGVVYEAVQTRLNRRVAVKVLPAERLETKGAVARFQIEAKAAASLHHSNIVPIFEAGEVNGVAFYAMQLIDGWGLDRIRDEIRDSRSRQVATRRASRDTRKKQAEVGATPQAGLQSTQDLGTTAAEKAGDFRLSGETEGGAAIPTDEDPKGVPNAHVAEHLTERAAEDARATWRSLPAAGEAHWRFVAQTGVQIASALHYAHQRGIVHRDVKPANIILDREQVAWLADFGLAKSGDLGLTGSLEAPGTLRYMAPERFTGESSPAADTYALGMTLYELLSLESPFAAGDRWEMMEQIRDGKLIPIRRFDASIPRDLETIITKSVAHQPADRYATAADMEEDLRRFLEGRPILARPVTSIERLYRWSRRNPALASSLAALLVMLCGVVLASTWAAFSFSALARNEAEQRRQADVARVAAEKAADQEQVARLEEQRQREFAESITEFVNRDILALTSVEGQMRFLPDQWESLGTDATLSTLMMRAARSLEARNDLAPDIEAELAWMIGISLRATSKFNDSIRMLELAVQRRREAYGENAEPTLAAENSLAVTYRSASRESEAIELFRQLINKHEQMYGKHSQEALLARKQYEVARIDMIPVEKAISNIQTLVAEMQPTLGETAWETLQAESFLAESYYNAGKFDQAIEVNTKVMAAAEANFDASDYLNLNVRRRQAKILQQLGQYDEAIKLASETYATTLRTMGPDNPFSIGHRGTLGTTLRRAGKIKEAIACVEEALRSARQFWGDEHIETLRLMLSLSDCYRDQGRDQEALTLNETVLATLRKKLGPSHRTTLGAEIERVNLLKRVGRRRESYELCQATLPLAIEAWGETHPQTITCKMHLAAAYEDMRNFSAAAEIYEQALELSLASGSPVSTAITSNNLAGVYLDLNRAGEAAELWEQAVATLTASLGPNHIVTLRTRVGQATGYERQGQTELAVQAWQEILTVQRQLLGEEHPDTLTTANNVGFGLLRLGDAKQSISVFESIIEPNRTVLGAQHPATLRAMGNLAAAYSNAEQHDQADALWRATIAGLKESMGAIHPSTQQMMRNFGVSLYGREKYDQAIEVFAEATEACREELGDQHPQTLRMAGNLGVNYWKNKQPQLAVETLLPVEQASRGNRSLQFVRQSLLQAAAEIDDQSTVMDVAKQELARVRSEFADKPLDLAEQMIDLAELLCRVRAYEMAKPLVDEYWLLSENSATEVSSAWRTCLSQSLGGQIALANADLESALSYLSNARDGLAMVIDEIPAARREIIFRECLRAGCDVLSQMQRDDVLAEWQNQLDKWAAKLPH